MKTLHYIQHISGSIFDPEEGKFFGQNWNIMYCDDKPFLENYIECEPGFFDACEIISEEFTDEQAFNLNIF